MTMCMYCAVLQVLQSMSSVKWDIKDIMSQHSAYVDLLIKVSIMALPHVGGDYF